LVLWRCIQLQINPEDLLPKLPRPRDLRPFPTAQALNYAGHTGKVRSVSVDSTGQWLATGTWRRLACIRTIPVESADTVRVTQRLDMCAAT